MERNYYVEFSPRGFVNETFFLRGTKEEVEAFSEKYANCLNAYAIPRKANYPALRREIAYLAKYGEKLPTIADYLQWYR